MFSYKLTRSHRKTLSLMINAMGEIEVRAPMRLPVKAITAFIQEKQDWLQEKLLIKHQQLLAQNSFQINIGAKILLRGQEYLITCHQNPSFVFEEGKLFVPENICLDDLKINIVERYKSIAKQVLTEKVIYYSNLLELYPQNIKINSAKTHWASCSGKNNLNFSWKLIMADDKTIDYVVIHELAHIKEKNHSKKFWLIVKQYQPDFNEQRLALKKLHSRLQQENWH